MKNILLIIFYMVVGLGISAQTLKEQAITKIGTLNDLIAEAESKGIDATKEKATIRTAEIFLEFADWDEANEQTNIHLFGMAHGFKDKPEYWASILPDFERNDVIKMLDDATEFLEKLADGTYERKPAVQLDWSTITHEGDQLTQNGYPVFLVDYTWKPDIPKLTDYHGNKDGEGIYVTWVQDNNGSINSYRLNQLQSRGDGRVGFVFMGNENPPEWTKDAYGDEFRLTDLTAKYPEVYTSEVSRFTDYDIDNPGAKSLVGNLIDGTVEYMAGKKFTEMGYMLCNEPHFYTTKTNNKPDWASAPVTQFTKEKFRRWLEQKHGTISTVNDLWGRSFTSFEVLDVEIPMDVNKCGTAEWYDWQKFNNQRVTDWFSWMKSKVVENDSLAKVHLKIMPSLWSENKRGHGIDFEALTELSEIIGNDCGSEYNNVWDWKTIEWDKDYSWNWRELAMSYDFLKSVSPEKPMINSESHFLSKSSSRDLYMEPDYARATSWMAHMKGLTYQQIWYWNRLEDGSPKTKNRSHAASNNQQPRIVNEIVSTYLDLNSYGEEVMAFQRLRKSVRIFYSETSALNKNSHLDDVFELYEDLAFDGIPLGFATKNIIEKQESSLWDVILVYKTEYVTQEELNALQKYLDGGGKVIIDTQSFTKDEYKRSLSALTASNGTLIYASNLNEFKTNAYQILEAKDCLPEIDMTENNSGTRDGCLWNVIRKSDGKHVLFVTNVGNTEATINISLKDATIGTQCKDLFKGIPVESKQVLKPYEMRFLEITDDTPVSAKNIHLNDEKIKVFPSPFSSRLHIDVGNMHFENLFILNMNGQLVKEYIIEGQQNITLNNTGLKAGMYILGLHGTDGRKFIKILKE